MYKSSKSLNSCYFPHRKSRYAPSHFNSYEGNIRISSIAKEIGLLITKIAGVVIVLFIVFTFVYGIYYNLDTGMIPMVKNGDLIVYTRVSGRYMQKDLVVLEIDGYKQILRVVAREYDTVDIREDGLYINGSLQQERDIYQNTSRYLEGIDFPVTLKENELFLLGDARENVTDSRIFGPVSSQTVVGKVITILRRRNL